VIVRIWRTRLDPTRLKEYEVFAERHSLPMLGAQRGFLGVLFAGVGSERAVISLWEDAEAVAALDLPPTYRDTVARISATGFLVGSASVKCPRCTEA
jgi:heme-degrading monooxygenase HmoA